MGEEGVGVLGHTAHDGVLGVEGTGTELCQRLLVDEGSEVVVVETLNLLNLVRRAEAVEEVHEGHAALDGSQVGHTGQVHHLLHGAFSQHGKARLERGHHVLMVAEDAEAVRGQCAGADMEHAGQQLAGNLVHVGNHQQQALAGGVGGGEGTRLQRAVHSACGASLRLHLLHHHGLAEDVLTSRSSPFVDMLSHRRRGRNGVDGSHLGKHVRDVSRSFVAITSDQFLFFCHNPKKLFFNG